MSKQKILSVLTVAIICHEANRALCESLGDHSQKPWLEAEEGQRVSAFKGVNFTLDNPDLPASANHDSWLKEKEETGWKYGPVKSFELKEHPCMVPYEELAGGDQAKDHLFRGIVLGLSGLIARDPVEAAAEGSSDASTSEVSEAETSTSTDEVSEVASDAPTAELSSPETDSAVEAAVAEGMPDPALADAASASRC
ncbi:MAG: RyR domain-containing protein [Pyrinomonadaceae bacterium]